jgi:class 3 adenylate cyclase/streptogramin lyase
VPPQARRRLATVLFLDIVGSTALAGELGDARWRELLTRFRRTVRTELKRLGGREQDTAGDGFFATFGEPAQALRAAAEIAVAVQRLGIDVRTGIHTGECEEIDGKLGGIAVHVGARVMSLAGPAEVLVTSTVTDLVSGAGATFEDRGTHELKGIEGTRHVFALTAVERRLPPPLTREQAAERLEGLTPSRISRRTRVAVVAAAILVVGAAAAAGVLAFRGGGASAAEPIDLIRLNPKTRQVQSLVHGRPLGMGLYENLWESDGTLWQMTGRDNARLVARDIRTGAQGVSIALGADACSCKIAFGFGSVWLAKKHTVDKGPHIGEDFWTVDRIAPVSGRTLHTYRISGDRDVSTIATGNGAVWVLKDGGQLLRIDPTADRITGMWETNGIEYSILVPFGGYEWICECVVSRVRRFDARTGTSRTFKIPTEAFLVGAFGKKLFFLDPRNATITPMDPDTGHTDAPVGLSGNAEQGVVAYGALWVAEGRHVERFDLANNSRALIQMPRRFYAGGIAADPTTHSLWVSNSSYPRPPDQG